MTEYDYAAIWVGSISLAVLVIGLVVFFVFQKRQGKYKKEEFVSGKKKTSTSKNMQRETKPEGAGNVRLDGARVSHRSTHPDRVAEESMWKEKKEQENDVLQQKMESERKNKLQMIFCPCNGEVAVYAENMEDAKEYGLHRPGLVFVPHDDKIYAPINGRVNWKKDKDNTVVIKSDGGTELYLRMQKDGGMSDELLTMKAAEGSVIGVGEPLCQFQSGLIRKGNKVYTIDLVLESYHEGQLMMVKRTNYVSHGDKIITLRAKA